ncbi:MAG: MMPL family transporter [Solirubrobacterales bacterium]
MSGGDLKGDGLGLRRPRAALLVAAVLVVVLGIVGIGVEDELRPTSLAVPGSPSAAGEALQREHFGDSAPFAIVLRGPAAALDRQGPDLVRALRRQPGLTTLSPWDRGDLDRLRPSPRKALVLADFHVDSVAAVQDAVPDLEATIAAVVHPPVAATQTGFATLSRAIQEESVRSTRIAELIAVPILLVVLLLVFRSPVAALIPLVFGAAAVVSVRGLLSVIAGWLEVDGFALTVASMMGLALGVDYALLMVSRFREELAAGSGPRAAAARTRRTAGRTTAYAGSTLLLAMLVILWIMPGTLFLSLAGTAILVTLVSVLIAAFVAPPLLFLLGPNVDRWRLGDGDGGARLMALVGAALARPRLAAASIGGVLVLLALPALALKTGPPSVAQLPESNRARRDAETVDRAIGAGWDAPFVLLAAAQRGSIANPGRLALLHRLQDRIAKDPAVQTVIGPGQIEKRARRLREGGNEVLAEEGDASPRQLRRLGRRLDRAAGGVKQLRAGISEASAGAGLLATGSGRGAEGAERIAAGLASAAGGADEAVEALGRLDRGSGRLAEGQRRAALGARSLRDDLSALMPVIRRGGLETARSLRAELHRASRTDPSLEAAAGEAEELVEVLTRAREQAREARNASDRLHDGQERLAEGGAKLHAGAAKLHEEAEALPGGLAELESGAEELARGLGSLTGGADSLARHLAEGYGASQPLQTRLRSAGTRVSARASRLSDRVGELRTGSPRIFDSGYFVLSALAGAPPGQRRRASRVVDLEHGGQAAQMLIVPRYTFNTPGSEALNARLQGRAAALAAGSSLTTGVTGGPAQIADYTGAISARVPLIVLGISLATFLVLVVVLRAVPLAALAVALNLLTVAVAFGILTLLFDLPAGWPLGGRTYVDAIGAAGIFGIVFGLSIDYAVFLLSRMREAREAGAGNRAAIEFGLARTARVITGAAVIMVAVFVAFAAAPIATVSQLGVGLTVAVLLDATVVRIVLLPALMLLIGERVWWLPSRLEKSLPRIGTRTV